jgi:hypothetical protein
MAAASHAGARARRVRAGGPGTRRPVVDLRRGGAGPAAPRGGPVQERVSGGRGAWTARDRLLRGRPGARREPRRDDPERDRASSARPRAARRKADTRPAAGPPSDGDRCGDQVIGADRVQRRPSPHRKPDGSNRPASLDAPSSPHTPRRWLVSCEPEGTAGTGKSFPTCCTCLRASCTFPSITVARALLARAMARRRSPPSCATVAASTPRPFLNRHKNHVIDGPSNSRGSPIVGQVAGETGR